MVPARPVVIGGGLLESQRYGICCLNQRGYRSFALEQTREILQRYAVDAIFFDMLWWASICLCTACRERFLNEAGHAIPTTIDWLDRAEDTADQPDLLGAGASTLDYLRLTRLLARARALAEADETVVADHAPVVRPVPDRRQRPQLRRLDQPGEPLVVGAELAHGVVVGR